MINFSVGVRQDRGFVNYSVRREGNSVTISPPDTGRRNGWHGYNLELNGDRVELRTPERQYSIMMNAEGVTVEDPRSRGMRAGYDLVISTPLKPEQYEAMGLSVASSLIGIPLPAEFLKA